MTMLQKFQIIAQMIGSAGLLITLIINYRKFRIMNEQVHEVRRSTAAQHILTLLSFIESDEIRAALNLVSFNQTLFILSIGPQKIMEENHVGRR